MTNGMGGAGQQIFVLPEGTLRTLGKDAQHTNIAAAKVVSDAVRTTLGPKGMDKMLVDSMGDIVITNDGVTILEEMQVEHPAAKMVVEVAKTQDEEVGDGTTTAAILAGELLKRAEGLLDQEIHPTVITRGYKLAKEQSLKLVESVSKKITEKDDDLLKKIAITAMTGKSAERASEHLAGLAVKAVKMVIDRQDGKISIDTDNIKVEKKQGGTIEDTELVNGLIIDKEIVHPGMPRTVKGAKVALVDTALEIEKTETDAQIQITSPDQMQKFLEQEEKMLKDMVEKIANSGCTVLFCQKGIDDVAQHYLSKKKIMSARRVKKSDMEKLVRATGARIVTSLDDLGKDDLGFAGLVEEKKVAGEQMLFVKECKDPKAVSLLVRGGTEHVVEEVYRAVEDAIGGVASSIEVGQVVAGGGSPEEAVAKGLRDFAQKYSGREQLAILAFSEAMEVIPRTLAENAGLDPIDILVELRAAHDKGQNTSGVNVFTGKIVDMWKEGVIEPLKIKTQAISSASEAAEMILRIDDIITANRLSGGPPGMPPGMGHGGDHEEF
ncbi:MAG: TCP-1/cpn60 chaperonin family protein [Candidatus Aenigmarchaeota archaeon]|nr:TCP-1/cpn60 chaperonin family protein [Candidatus Aenigmarchaeota archaeon]